MKNRHPDLTKYAKKVTVIAREPEFTCAKSIAEKVLKNLESATSLQACEDIYAPFKEKKSSRTTSAIENGLEPLANIIQSMRYSLEEINQKAKQFLNENVTNIDGMFYKTPFNQNITVVHNT